MSAAEKKRTLEELRARDLEWSHVEIQRLREAIRLALRQGGGKAWRRVLLEVLEEETPE
jgi:hypothetical protein